MGAEDVRRQALNVFRMELLGARVRVVESGSRTLKDAMNEALRDWITNVEDTFCMIGSAAGPHPDPMIVRELQRVIGEESRRQIVKATGRLPDAVIACVGGGSNAIGIFFAFLKDLEVKLCGVEAGGREIKRGHHAARFEGGQLGVLQGAKTWILQSPEGQIDLTHSVSAGLDYAAVGPEHAYYKEKGRIDFGYATDTEALQAFQDLMVRKAFPDEYADEESAQQLGQALYLGDCPPSPVHHASTITPRRKICHKRP